MWDGEKGATMIKELGYTHASFVGFTLDGRGKAGTGIQHTSNLFGTNMLYRHVAFIDIDGNGISVGLPRHSPPLETAETLLDNCLFERCFRGVYIGEYNDYDWVFNGCEFRDCVEGIVDIYGCAYVRDCHFERSRLVDIREHGHHGGAVWRCTSFGSGVFLDFSIPAASYIMQDCNIDAWTDRRGAVLLNGAPFAMSDCTIGNPSTSLYPEELLSKGRPMYGIRILGKEAQRVILSNNTMNVKGVAAPLTRKEVLGDHCLGFDCGKVYEIPSGARSGSMIKSARQVLPQNLSPDARQNLRRQVRLRG